jgi:hypothetical protein
MLIETHIRDLIGLVLGSQTEQKAGQRHLGLLGHLSARPSFLPSASRWR